MKTMAVIGVVAACALQAALASTDRRTPVVEAVEKALPSVVNIGTERLVKVRYTDPFRRFRGDLFDQFFSDFFSAPASPGYRVTHSLGSGVIIDPAGYILTNHHVTERATRIQVTLADGTPYDAVLLAGDEISDLALLKIEPGKPLQAVEFSSDEDLMLGETVIALGNPFGLSQTVTVGVLSSKNREARYEGQVLYRDILQTDAAVNPGSSGGPLLNIDGELIGINVAIYQEAQNIGFAVPVVRARTLAAGWLSPRAIGKRTMGFEAVSTNGLLVVSAVETNSPAATAGVGEGDVIRAVGGRPVRDLFDFNRALLGYPAGSTVPLSLERGGVSKPVEVWMAALPKPSGRELALRRLGIEFADQAALMPGLVVGRVAEAGAGAKTGLVPGLVLTNINGAEVASVDDVGLALENVRAGDTVVLGLLSLEEKGSFVLAQRSSVQMKAD